MIVPLTALYGSPAVIVLSIVRAGLWAASIVTLSLAEAIVVGLLSPL